MSIVGLIKNAALGAVAGVSAIVALPVFGAVGSITATGAAIGSVIGAVAGVCDEINKAKKAPQQ